MDGDGRVPDAGRVNGVPERERVLHRDAGRVPVRAEGAWGADDDADDGADDRVRDA